MYRIIFLFCFVQFSMTFYFQHFVLRLESIFGQLTNEIFSTETLSVIIEDYAEFSRGILKTGILRIYIAD